MTRGFVDTARFEPVFAVEWDATRPRPTRRTSATTSSTDLIEDVDSFPQADVVIGGPPCQGFSPLNMRGVGLERRGLWREYLRALEQAEPPAFVMENVPELLRSAEYAAFARRPNELGFEVEGRVLNAADYGVPQTRRRAFVIGVREGEPPWPEQTHCPPDASSPGGPAVADLPGRRRGPAAEADRHGLAQPAQPAPMSLERYRTIPNEGEGRFDLAARRPDITPPCWLRKKTGSTDVFGRLWWDRPAFTIRTEFYKPEKGRYLHPSEHRPITVREAARCMTSRTTSCFPEDQPMTSVAQADRQRRAAAARRGIARRVACARRRARRAKPSPPEPPSRPPLRPSPSLEAPPSLEGGRGGRG